MAFDWGGLAQGLGSAIGGLGAAAMSGADAKDVMEKQISWERERAKNAHQWEVEDLKAAGLNPILSAGGDGATTGGISAPMPDRSGIASAGAGFVEALNTAADTTKLKAETAQSGAQTANLNADTKNKTVENGLIQAQTELAKANAGLISKKEAFQNLQNIQEEIKAEYAKLSFWNKEANTAAETVNYLMGAPAKMLNEIMDRVQKKSGQKFQNYDNTAQNFNMQRI